MAEITRKNPEGVHAPFSSYTHSVSVDGAKRIVFCAGQVAADADGKVLPPTDFDEQARMVMSNLEKALAAGGASFADVTKVTIYIVDPRDFAKARGILSTYFGANPPASTLCVLRGLAHPDFLVEVEAVAAV